MIAATKIIKLILFVFVNELCLRVISLKFVSTGMRVYKLRLKYIYYIVSKIKALIRFGLY